MVPVEVSAPKCGKVDDTAQSRRGRISAKCTARGVCRYQARRSDFSVELPLDPFHGTVGVAPAGALKGART